MTQLGKIKMRLYFLFTVPGDPYLTIFETIYRYVFLAKIAAEATL
jgi:hypothetical protein